MRSLQRETSQSAASYSSVSLVIGSWRCARGKAFLPVCAHWEFLDWVYVTGIEEEGFSELKVPAGQRKWYAHNSSHESFITNTCTERPLKND